MLKKINYRERANGAGKCAHSGHTPVGPAPNILPATPADSQRIDSAIEERMLAQIKPKSAQSFEPLSGEAERDFLTDATTDEMKSYFERKYPGGAR